MFGLCINSNKNSDQVKYNEGQITLTTTGGSSEYRKTSLMGIHARSWAPKNRTSTFSSEFTLIAFPGQNGKPFNLAQTSRWGILQAATNQVSFFV